MSEKEDAVADKIEQEAIERTLDRIIDGRMSIRIADKIVVFRTPTDNEKFEADMIAQNHVEELRMRDGIKLYDAALVPMLVRKRCDAAGIDYSLVNDRAELFQKMMDKIAKLQESEEKPFKDLDNQLENIGWYIKLRKEIYTPEELIRLEQVEAIEQMVAEYKLKTFEHYADRARKFYLIVKVAEIFEEGEYKTAFIFKWAETAFGKLPVSDVIDKEWKLNQEDWTKVFEKFNSFMEGVGPNFMSLLSGLLPDGGESGLQAENSESPLSEEEPSQNGQPTN